MPRGGGHGGGGGGRHHGGGLFRHGGGPFRHGGGRGRNPFFPFMDCDWCYDRSRDYPPPGRPYQDDYYDNQQYNQGPPYPNDPYYQQNQQQYNNQYNQNSNSQQEQNPFQNQQNLSKPNQQQNNVRQLETYNNSQRQSVRSNQNQENQPMLNRDQQQQQYGAQYYQNSEYPPQYPPDYPPPPRRGGFGPGGRGGFGPGGRGGRHPHDDPYVDMPPPGSQIERMQYGRSFEEVEDRLNFMKKVFGLLVVQLLITVAAVMVPLINSTAKLWIKTETWLFCVSIALWVLILISLVLNREYARKVPLNYLLLFAFTFCLSYSVMYIAAISTPLTVMTAAIFTVALVIGLSIYAYNATTDLTYGGATVAIFMPMIMILIVQAVCFRNEVIIDFICVFACIILGYYMIFHLQTIVGGGRYELNSDDYVIGSIIIYVDTILIFVVLIQLIGKR